jgi:hypothetical protein
MKKIINHLKENWIKYGFETLVVTVGILGAFTLNNWNENRKEKIRETILLTELAKNIESNINILEDGLETQLQWIKEINYVVNHIDLKRSYSDSLGTYLNHIRYAESLSLTTTAFESLKSNGFDLIHSTSLRLEIIRLFDEYYENISNLINTIGLSKYNSANRIFEKCCGGDNNGQIIPNDYNSFLENQELHNMITLRLIWKNTVVSRYSFLLEETKNLHELVLDELAHRN